MFKKKLLDIESTIWQVDSNNCTYQLLDRAQQRAASPAATPWPSSWPKLSRSRQPTAEWRRTMSNDTQSPGPNPLNNAQLEVHAGWVRSGQDGTPGQKAYYINLEAKPGNGDKVEQFLRDKIGRAHV